VERCRAAVGSGRRGVWTVSGVGQADPRWPNRSMPGCPDRGRSSRRRCAVRRRRGRVGGR
jgi:hypothetical protein